MAEKLDVTTNADGTWKLDAAAFNPEPAGYLTIDGKEYPIFSFMDINIDDFLSVIKIADDVTKLVDPEERMKRSIKQIMMLNAGPEGNTLPKLTEPQLRRLSPRQLVVLTIYAMEAAKVPQVPDKEKQSESVSSAPVSGVSTAGVTAS